MNSFAKVWLVVYCFGPLLMIVLDECLERFLPQPREGE